MWKDYLGWVLTLLIMMINIWLFISIYRSKEAKRIYLFLFIYSLIINDCLGFSSTFYHDIPSFYAKASILQNIPLLYDITIVILCCQWFYHLFFLPVFSLLHFFALFFPIQFRRFDNRSTYALIGLLYCLTAAVTMPLFTSCCGYKYYALDGYWFFDFNKPYTSTYQTGNNMLQAVCVVVMVSTTVAIVGKLYFLRRKNVLTNRASVIVASSSHRIETDVTAASGGSNSRRSIRGGTRLRVAVQPVPGTLTPEVRLAISFLLLSGCWLASTLTYNLLMGNTDPFLAIISLTTSYLNRGKWIVYCLGNRSIRKLFTAPLKACGVL